MVHLVNFRLFMLLLLMFFVLHGPSFSKQFLWICEINPVYLGHGSFDMPGYSCTAFQVHSQQQVLQYTTIQTDTN